METPTSSPSPVSSSKKPIIIAGVIVLVIVIVGLFFIYGAKGPTSNQSAAQSQPLIVEKGNQVDPATQNAVITGYLEEKQLFATGTIAQIRQYVIDGTPAQSKATVTTQMAAVTDSEMQKIINNYNQLFSFINESELRSASSTWSFTQAKDRVQIVVAVSSSTAASTTPANVTIDMIYTNGQWY